MFFFGNHLEFFFFLILFVVFFDFFLGILFCWDFVCVVLWIFFGNPFLLRFCLCCSLQIIWESFFVGMMFVFFVGNYLGLFLLGILSVFFLWKLFGMFFGEGIVCVFLWKLFVFWGELIFSLEIIWELFGNIFCLS